MSETMPRRVKATAEWVCSMRVLVARDGDASDVPLGNGFVVDPERPSGRNKRLLLKPLQISDRLLARPSQQG